MTDIDSPNDCGSQGVIHSDPVRSPTQLNKVTSTQPQQIGTDIVCKKTKKLRKAVINEPVTCLLHGRCHGDIVALLVAMVTTRWGRGHRVGGGNGSRAVVRTVFRHKEGDQRNYPHKQIWHQIQSVASCPHQKKKKKAVFGKLQNTYIYLRCSHFKLYFAALANKQHALSQCYNGTHSTQLTGRIHEFSNVDSAHFKATIAMT